MKKIKSYQVFKIIVYIFLPIIIGFFCWGKNEAYETNIALYILPFLYSLATIILEIVNRRQNISLPKEIIKFVCFIRYVIIPFTYYMDFQNYNEFYIKNKDIVLQIMCIELISLYVVLALYKKKDNSKYLSNYDENYKIFNIFTVSIVCAFAVILCMYPSLIFRVFTNVEGSFNLSSTVQLIYNFGIVILNLGILKFIKNLKTKEKIKILISMGIILISILLLGVNQDGDISRWTMLINLVINIIILTKYYYRSKKIIGIIFSLIVVCVLVLGTFIKFNDDEVNSANVYEYITSEVINYETFDVYFAGPFQIDNAVEVRKNNEIDITNLFVDIFANCPIINNYLDKSETTPTLYNLEYYNSYIAKDKICPLSGQAYIYFGIALSSIFSIISLCLAIKFNNLAIKSNNEFQLYVNMYLSLILSLATCLNINIIFQTIWISILPIYIIYKLNIGLKRRSAE